VRRGALLALWVVACGARPTAPEKTTEPARLELRVDARDARDVRVEGHFVHGGSAKLALPDETLRGLKRFEVRRGGGWAALDPRALAAPECATDCTLRYAIDLAKTQRSFEGVLGVGAAAFVAPTPTWMAHPDPMPPGAFDLVIDGAAAAGPTFTAVPFATGMRRRDATHYFEPTDDYWEGSFAAFGKLRHRTIRAAGARIEIVLVSDTPLALTDDQVAAWIASDAACVAQLYRHFPVPRATIFVVPIDGASEVVFGKVLSMGGASIIALTGTRFPEKTTHSDWVLVHEMTHLGFPTMGGVRWLTEGLATYYEPLLRTRAGWFDPKWLWGWFLGQMPRGMEGAARGLEKGDSIDDTYWGGALFLLLADVGIREATGGKKSLDDVMHAVLDRGGDATVAWTLPEVLAVAREATGTRVVDDLVRAMVVHGERIDVASTFAKLGVRASGKDVVLDDTAPEAAVRRAIESGH
jgi:hypothetical protein